MVTLGIIDEGEFFGHEDSEFRSLGAIGTSAVTLLYRLDRQVLSNMREDYDFLASLQLGVHTKKTYHAHRESKVLEAR